MLNVLTVFGQKKSQLEILSSKGSQGFTRNGVNIIKIYKGVFKHENTVLTCDSGYLYKAQNTCDAFGHVTINQGDTLNVYADKLNYNGNTHLAILTDNVRMVDKDATLSTNYLTYNTATRIGTYTGGGKLINKTNTLVSQNGYYFANSRDSYFRYNVVLTTNDAVIKTDTLRYNSGSRIAFFYGPTRILGKTDKDTLYTENGNYNTITEQAFFGKKNLYTQGTKSLKGDSLFYDRLKGYGRAVKNITFNDEEQKITLKGDLGTYYKSEERAVVTQNAYVIIVTENRDTTKKDTAEATPAPKAKKEKKVTIKNAPPNTVPLKKVPDNADKPIMAATDSAKVNVPAEKPQKVKRDSIFIAADTLETQILVYKKLKELQERMRTAHIKDTAAIARAAELKKVPMSTSKHLIMAPFAGIPKDTSFLRRNFFGAPKPKPVDTTQKAKAALAAKKPAVKAPPKNLKPDSVYMTRKFELSDTSRIRILSAYHHVKIFKSDLQAKSDSMFYSYSDSTMRCYVEPMFWTQNSQLSGDTIYLQLKNKKLDNMDIFPSALIVNIDKADSVNFNQVAGKKMRGFFVDSKLQRMFVDGNAETIYYDRDSIQINHLTRSVSSRIRVNFRDNKAINVTKYTKVEDHVIPIPKVKDEDKLLKNFKWKPKERPASKEEVIHPKPQKPVVKKATPKGKLPVVKPPAQTKGKPALKDSTATKAPAVKDSIAVKPAAKDSVKAKPVQDTTALKPKKQQ
nr:OstA-like protein [Mucilaginibacter sp. Bleaf8]